MTNNKVKTCDDIFDYIEFLERKADTLEKERNSLKFSFFNREAKERKKAIKASLKKIDEILDYYNDFLYDATTFQREDLDVFFVKYFTALYGIEYTVEENAKDKSEGSYWIPTDIIASKRDFVRIDKKFNFKRKVDVEDIIDMCQDSCLCIGGPEEYTLLEGTRLSEELEGFPEIAEAVKILVDLKLSAPDLSDKKRLALGLKIIIERLNKKTPTYNKEQSPSSCTSVPQKAPQVQEPLTREMLVKKQTPPVTSKPVKTSFTSSFTSAYSEVNPSVTASRQPTQEPEQPKVLTKSLMGKYIHHK